MSIPRPEYPRPQFVRENWQNLNGEWQYKTDRARSGKEKGYTSGGEFDEKIIVPFCRESELSGIGDKDFCAAAWYRKKIDVTEQMLADDKHTLLHIGACDFKTELYVNGSYCGSHIGGYVSFSFDITRYLTVGENTLTIYVEDDTRDGFQPSGKQSDHYNSYGCFYTRTTGIWQTVWLETVPCSYIEYTKFYPHIDKAVLYAEVYTKYAEGMTVKAQAYLDGVAVGCAEGIVYDHVAKMTIHLDTLKLWQVGEGNLYDLELTMGEDRVKSYFGMRQIECRDGIMYLNGKPVFQRLVLDQGFYPDGIYTAPNYEALVGDIELALKMGFNGARLHEKVFEPLFLSYCDKKGYIVWGEHGNWGLNHQGNDGFASLLPEWLEEMRRDFNHPAIIGWCPLNETPWDTNMQLRYAIADLTRSYDNTRIYIDASGWSHTEGLSDIYDLHDYDQNPVSFREKLQRSANGEKISLAHHGTPEPYFGTITFVSEYGGTWWSDSTDGWGYGSGPSTIEELHERFQGLTEAIMQTPTMGGLCYTQLTDVEQEQNGMYTYDRKPKFDPERTYAVLSQIAEIEK